MTTGYGKDRRWPFAEGGGATITLFTLIWLTGLMAWRKATNPITSLFLLVSSTLWLLILYFFRDPHRQVIDEPGLVVAPGDGKVMEIVRQEESEYLRADSVRISLFLNITDVHVQRAPLGGRVALVAHRPGKFRQAFRPEASDVNEYVAMVIETAYGRILVKQIAGILARRCINYTKPGDMIATGQRFGLIRFGSRVDLFLPPDATLLIQVGDKVYGGMTPVARLPIYEL